MFDILCHTGNKTRFVSSNISSSSIAAVLFDCIVEAICKGKKESLIFLQGYLSDKRLVNTGNKNHTMFGISHLINDEFRSNSGFLVYRVILTVLERFSMHTVAPSIPTLIWWLTELLELTIDAIILELATVIPSSGIGISKAKGQLLPFLKELCSDQQLSMLLFVKYDSPDNYVRKVVQQLILEKEARHERLQSFSR